MQGTLVNLFRVINFRTISPEEKFFISLKNSKIINRLILFFVFIIFTTISFSVYALQYKYTYTSDKIENNTLNMINDLTLDRVVNDVEHFTDLNMINELIFFDTGELNEEKNYNMGVLEGKTSKWYLNGNLMHTGLYKNGLKDGNWESYLKNGLIYSKGLMIEGRKKAPFNFTSYYGDSSKIKFFSKVYDESINITTFLDYYLMYFDINGELIYEKNYINDQLDGKATWYKFGQKSFSGYYKKGLADGDWTYWSKKGQITKTEIFLDGIRIGLTKYKYGFFDDQIKTEKKYYEGNCISGC